MQLQPNTLFDNRYTLKRLIGRGGFAEVWLVEDTLTGLEEALKIYAPGAGMDEDGVRMFVKELSVVHDLRHTNLLTPKTMGQYERQPYLVMPFCPNGSLTKRVGNISEDEAWKVLRQVAAGLAYLHEGGIVHQDIKPDNILIDARGNYVITDFGISLKAQSTLRKSMRDAANSGTMAYMAPERFSADRKPRSENDVWSLGTMMFELLDGDVPFMAQMGGLAQMNGAQLPYFQNEVPESLQQVVYSMLALTPEERPTAAELACASSNGQSQAVPTVVKNPTPASQPDSHATQRIDIDALQSSQNQPPMGADGIYTANGVSFKMIRVDGGTFQMGSNQGDGDEQPIHQVTLSSYSLGETEVTQALWEAVMGSNPSEFKGQKNPVECVSWNDCQTFIKKLNTLTGQNFRLPTEAEWEFAARGGNNSKGYKYAGSNNIDEVAWYNNNSNNNSYNKTQPVAQKKSNELGLYDMSGNVWEWCQDWYGAYSPSAQTDPKGPNSGDCRVIRGGGWLFNADYCRCAYRGRGIAGSALFFLGLRLAL